MLLSTAVLLKSHFKQVRAHYKGIFLSILYLNIGGHSLFTVLLRTKLLLLVWGIINFYSAFDQRELTVSSSLKIPFICKITLRKKKSTVSSKLSSDQKKKKNDNCAVALSRQVKAEVYSLSWCSLPPSSAPQTCLL